MEDSKYYINSKTNSILKNTVVRNNRDIVATILYNELTDLLNYSRTAEGSTPADVEMLRGYIGEVRQQLYTDVPMKLQKYCENCPCCDDCCSTCSFPDCFVLGLLLEDGTPWLQEITDGEIFFLEKQRESECYGRELICDCSLYSNCSCGKQKCQCVATLQWESISGSVLWDCDKPILLESQELCNGVCCDCECTKDPVIKYLGPIKWENDTTIQLEKCLDLLLEGDYTSIYYEDEPCECERCTGEYCSICKKSNKK